MKRLTLIDLVVRSMRKNIKHYYLYFFALIFAVSLYFIFATLQYDPTIFAEAGTSKSLSSSFKVGRVLLIMIVSVFLVYANAIFLKRRSKEIGLYQLIGLTRAGVARMLMIENILLSIGALLVGIGIGALASRLFVLLLLRVTGLEGTVALSFSMTALYATLKVFFILIVVTSLQMLWMVYRTSLIELFRANEATEAPKEPRGVLTAITALLGFGLVAFGYWLSQHMLNSFLLVNMLLVLFSTIFGSYLIFRVTISWVFYRIRRRKDGQLTLKDSLSLAPLMHRMKGNATSLTMITTLSAMTMAMIAFAYSFYYTADESARLDMPNDFGFDEESEIYEPFKRALTEKGIDYTEVEVVSYEVPFTFTADKLPQFVDKNYQFSIVSSEALKDTRYDEPTDGTNLHYKMMAWIMQELKLPAEGQIDRQPITIDRVSNGNVFNMNGLEGTLVVDPALYETLKASKIEGSERTRYMLNIRHDQDQKEAYTTFTEMYGAGQIPVAYYGLHEVMVQSGGMFIFITAFLSLVFLLSTGSILYFKQMSEAEQERQSYRTLRQLGFSVSEIMGGIRRKQLFVYGLPLLIGILHATFAVKSASGVLFQTDITVPVIVSFVIYSFIYAIFGILTVRYYRHIVKETL